MLDPLSNLTELLRPFTITMNADVVNDRRDLVVSLANCGLDAYTLVAAAHGQFPGHAAETVLEAINEIDPSAVIAGETESCAVLSAVALAIRLADEGRDDRTLHALLTESAAFLGLAPRSPLVAALTAEVIAAESRRSRRRLEGPEAVGQVRALLAAAHSSAEVAVDAASLAAAVKSRDAALRAVAKRVEDLVVATAARNALIDEELDLLWWSRRGRCNGLDEPWTEIPSNRRAVAAATDVSELLAHAPAPAGARSLLSAAIGDDAQKKASFADFAAEIPAVEGRERLLLTPLLTYASISAELGPTARTVVAGVFGKSVSGPGLKLKRPLLDYADQLVVELQIVTLL